MEGPAGVKQSLFVSSALVWQETSHFVVRNWRQQTVCKDCAKEQSGALLDSLCDTIDLDADAQARREVGQACGGGAAAILEIL